MNLAGEVVKEEPPLIKARVVLYAMAPECNCSTGKIIGGEFFEFGFIEILVVLGMRMQTYELPDIDCLAGIVVEDKFNTEISGASGCCNFQSAHLTTCYPIKERMWQQTGNIHTHVSPPPSLP